jgi:serine/threonine protein phosphatase PrpC
MDDPRIDVGPPLTLAPRDTLVVASDGLFDNATAVEIVDGIRTGDAEKSLSATMELARRRMRAEDAWFEGKPDDLTAILYRPQPRPSQPRRRK